MSGKTCTGEKEKDNIEGEIISKKRERLRYTEESKIKEARYNKRYKGMLAKGVISRYLLRNLCRINLGEGIRALVRVKCGNLGERNNTG